MKQEIYQLLVDLDREKFRTVYDFTSSINKTIFNTGGDSDKVQVIFEYTNEQIIKLGLDRVSEAKLYKNASKAQEDMEEGTRTKESSLTVADTEKEED